MSRPPKGLHVHVAAVIHTCTTVTGLRASECRISCWDSPTCAQKWKETIAEYKSMCTRKYPEKSLAVLHQNSVLKYKCSIHHVEKSIMTVHSNKWPTRHTHTHTHSPPHARDMHPTPSQPTITSPRPHLYILSNLLYCNTITKVLYKLGYEANREFIINCEGCVAAGLCLCNGFFFCSLTTLRILTCTGHIIINTRVGHAQDIIQCINLDRKDFFFF